MVENGIKPFYVFYVKPPVFKSGEVSKIVFFFFEKEKNDPNIYIYI